MRCRHNVVQAQCCSSNVRGHLGWLRAEDHNPQRSGRCGRRARPEDRLRRARPVGAGSGDPGVPIPLVAELNAHLSRRGARRLEGLGTRRVPF